MESENEDFIKILDRMAFSELSEPNDDEIKGNI